MRINRRAACALLDVSATKLRQLIRDGVVPEGRGLGPRPLSWDRDELIAIRDGKHSRQQEPTEITEITVADAA
jgi:hypothetical protein